MVQLSSDPLTASEPHEHYWKSLSSERARFFLAWLLFLAGCCTLTGEIKCHAHISYVMSCLFVNCINNDGGPPWPKNARAVCLSQPVPVGFWWFWVIFFPPRPLIHSLMFFGSFEGLSALSSPFVVLKGFWPSQATFTYFWCFLYFLGVFIWSLVGFGPLTPLLLCFQV